MRRPVRRIASVASVVMFVIAICSVYVWASEPWWCRLGCAALVMFSNVLTHIVAYEDGLRDAPMRSRKSRKL